MLSRLQNGWWLPVILMLPSVGFAAQYSILFTGDIHFGEIYQQEKEQKGRTNILKTKGWEHTVEGLRPFLNNSDVVVSNLESPITPETESPYAGTKRWLHREPPARIHAFLSQYPFGVVSLANNHSLDFGLAGLRETEKHLAALKLPSVGAGRSLDQAAQPFHLEFHVGGEKVGMSIFAGFEHRSVYEQRYQHYATETRPGVNPLDTRQIADAVARIRANDPDRIIVVFPHWGPNYRWKSRRQNRWAKQLLRSGVDLIIGHGAHCLQELMIFRHRLTVFSLGNFIMNSGGRYKLHSAPPFSLVARIVFWHDGKRLRRQLRLYPILCSNRKTGYRSRPVDQKQFDDVIKLLSERDWRHRVRTTMTPGADELGRYLGFRLGRKLHIQKSRPSLVVTPLKN